MQALLLSQSLDGIVSRALDEDPELVLPSRSASGIDLAAQQHFVDDIWA